MSDAEIPQHKPGSEDPPTPSDGAPAAGAPDGGRESPSKSLVEGLPTVSDLVPAIQPGAPADGAQHATTRLARVKQLLSGRNAAWAAVAGLCVALGAVASLLGARDVARNDSAAARQAFPRTSTAIAS